MGGGFQAGKLLVEATLSSQFSGWKMPGKDVEGYINPIGSGLGKAIARNDFFPILATKTASLAGSIQVCSRTIKASLSASNI